MDDETGAGSLKVVVATSGDVRMAESTLWSIAGDDGLRQVGPREWVIYSAVEAAEIRDRLVAAVGEVGTVFVAEFERWSAFGDRIDAAWLLRRGH